MPTPSKQRRYWSLHLPDPSSPLYRALLELACSIPSPVAERMMGENYVCDRRFETQGPDGEQQTVTQHVDDYYATVQAVVATKSDDELRSYLDYMDGGAAIMIKAYYNESTAHIIDAARAQVPAGLFRSAEGGLDNTSFNQTMRDNEWAIDGRAA